MKAVRRVVWQVGAPVRATLVGAICLYRFVLSGMLGGQCRFHPSCSHYAEEAIRVQGAFKGSLLAVWRVLRCNPYGDGGLDPVPLPRSAERRAPTYDGIISRAAGSGKAGA